MFARGSAAGAACDRDERHARFLESSRRGSHGVILLGNELATAARPGPGLVHWQSCRGGVVAPHCSDCSARDCCFPSEALGRNNGFVCNGSSLILTRNHVPPLRLQSKVCNTLRLLLRRAKRVRQQPRSSVPSLL
eukprot:3695437-Rhodomonas_salina.4